MVLIFYDFGKVKVNFVSKNENRERTQFLINQQRERNILKRQIFFYHFGKHAFWQPYKILVDLFLSLLATMLKLQSKFFYYSRCFTCGLYTRDK